MIGEKQLAANPPAAVDAPIARSSHFVRHRRRATAQHRSLPCPSTMPPGRASAAIVAAIWSLLCVWPANEALCDEPVPTNDVVLVVKFGSPSNTVYSVPRDKLPCRVTWSPGAEPLPLDLRSEVARAETLLSVDRQGTDRLDLTSVTICRMPFAGASLPGALTIPDSSAWGSNRCAVTSNWFVQLRFYQSPAQPRSSARMIERMVVTLLDGTRAAEGFEINRPTAPPARQGDDAKLGETAPAEQPTAQEASQRFLGTPIDGFALTQAPDFPPPPRTWNPHREQPPVDLGVLALKARDHLWGRITGPGRPGLRAVGLTKILIPKAPLGSDNWLVSLLFDEDHHLYTVYALLDGTILGAKENEGGHRSS